MRVTQQMMTQRSTGHISQSYDQMMNLQDQLSTGKKITRASQDPVVAMNGMRYRSQVGEVEQFERNVGEAHNWLDTSDAALGEATQVMQRVRELVTQASNDTYEGDQRGNIAKEISELKEQLISSANSKVGDKYIFNGSNTTNPPIDTDATADGVTEDSFTGHGDAVEMELMKGIKVEVNSEPGEVFNEQLFADLEQLQADLENPNTTGEDLQEYLGTLDEQMNSIVNERAELGARTNRIEMIESRLADQKVISNKIMSNNEDAELEEVITNLTNQQTVHEAALASAGRIMQTTLLDFLR